MVVDKASPAKTVTNEDRDGQGNEFKTETLEIEKGVIMELSLTNASKLLNKLISKYKKN